MNSSSIVSHLLANALLLFVSAVGAVNCPAAEWREHPPRLLGPLGGERIARPTTEIDAPLGPAVVVPDAVRKPLADARQFARLAKLPCATGTYYIAPEKWRDEIAVGSVGLQSPPAGVAVPEGTTLALWTFAKAAETQKLVAMPNLVGVDLAAARARLAKDKLPLLTVAEGEAPADTAKVVAQYPPPGRSVYEGTAVHLVVER